MKNSIKIYYFLYFRQFFVCVSLSNWRRPFEKFCLKESQPHPHPIHYNGVILKCQNVHVCFFKSASCSNTDGHGPVCSLSSSVFSQWHARHSPWMLDRMKNPGSGVTIQVTVRHLCHSNTSRDDVVTKFRHGTSAPLAHRLCPQNQGPQFLPTGRNGRRAYRSRSVSVCSRMPSSIVVTGLHSSQ